MSEINDQMEAVKLFNTELSSLYETRPPISKAKMTSITRTAIKAIKFYKHVVQSVEKFIQKCKPEYKVPGLYVIDSIVRQSRHQFTAEKDVFAPRFARNIQSTFVQLFNCPHDDKGKIVRVLNLWQKNQVFTPEVIQPLLDMASLANKDQLVASNGVDLKQPQNQSIQQRNIIESKPSPVKDQSWLSHSSVDANNTSSTPQPVTAPVMNKMPGSSAGYDPNIIQQLQSLQNLIIDKQVDSQQAKDRKDDTVKFDKKLLDFDYGEEEDEETSSPQPPTQGQPPLPSIDSLTSILSNPEVLRQLHTLQQQLANRQQQDMEDKMRRLQEMRHQEEEFDKHLAQTVPKLPFASECDFKAPVGTSGAQDCMALQHILQPPPTQQPPQPVAPPQGIQPPPGPPPPDFSSLPFRPTPIDEIDRSVDYDERSRQLSQQRGNAQDNGSVVEVIDLIRMESPGRDSPPRRRRRSRSRSRGRARSRSRSRRRRSRSNERDRDRDREYDRDWDNRKQRELEREKERERRRKGLPPIKKNHLAVCSTTLWIGHLSKLVQQEELSDTFGEYGDIVSINLIPPRGCAFVCMNRRQDAARALQQLKHYKLQGKAITIAWAPGKGMKDREWKDYWEVDQGVSYIPWNKLTPDTDFDLLEEGGMLDEETYPDWLKETMLNKREKDRQDNCSEGTSGGGGGPIHEKIEECSGGSLNQLPPELDIPMPNTTTMPGFIPIPETPTPVSQANMPPPMGLIPPFALPPNNVGLMGPMGMSVGPGGLLGNVPLGVPPPIMMPQQMVPRMPASPFNPPLLLGSGGGAAAGQPDKGKASLPQLGVPPPNTADTFPDHLASMVTPFGLPVPLSASNFQGRPLIKMAYSPIVSGNSNSQQEKTEIGLNSGLLGQNKGPAEMDVDDLNDSDSKDASLTATTQGLSLMNSMVGSGFGQSSTPFGGLALMQLPHHHQHMAISQLATSFQTNSSSIEKIESEIKASILENIKEEKETNSDDNNEKHIKRNSGHVEDTDMRAEQSEEKENDFKKKRRDSPVEDRRSGRKREWGKPRINRWGDELPLVADRRGRSPVGENSNRVMPKETVDRHQHLLGLPMPPEHHYQPPPNRNIVGGPMMGHFGGPKGVNCAFGPVDRDDRGSDERDDMLGYPPPLLNSPRGGHGFFPRGGGGMPPRSSPRPLLRTPNGPMFGPRGHPPGPGMMGLRGMRPGNRMEGMGFSMRGFPPPPPGARGRARFNIPPPLPRDRRWEEPRPRWMGNQEEERKSRWSSPADDSKQEIKPSNCNSFGAVKPEVGEKGNEEDIAPPGEEPVVSLKEVSVGSSSNVAESTNDSTIIVAATTVPHTTPCTPEGTIAASTTAVTPVEGSTSLVSSESSCNTVTQDSPPKELSH